MAAVQTDPNQIVLLGDTSEFPTAVSDNWQAGVPFTLEFQALRSGRIGQLLLSAGVANHTFDITATTAAAGQQIDQRSFTGLSQRAIDGVTMLDFGSTGPYFDQGQWASITLVHDFKPALSFVQADSSSVDQTVNRASQLAGCGAVFACFRVIGFACGRPTLVQLSHPAAAPPAGAPADDKQQAAPAATVMQCELTGPPPTTTVVGALCSVTLTNSGCSIIGTNYKLIGPQGGAVTGYTMTQASTIAPVEKTFNTSGVETSHEWNWAIPGSYTLLVDVTVYDGTTVEELSEKAVYTVVAPLVMGDVSSDTIVASQQTTSKGEVCVVQLGVGSGDDEVEPVGYKMAVTLMEPSVPVPGNIQMVQLVSTNRWRGAADGTRELLYSGGYVLDTTLPYGHLTQLIDGTYSVPVEIMSWDGVSDLEFVVDDAPQDGFPLPAGNAVDINDTFLMYVMYKPTGPDSIWVPLGVFPWYWKAHVDYISNAPRLSGNEAAVQIGRQAFEKNPGFPTWSAVLSNEYAPPPPVPVPTGFGGMTPVSAPPPESLLSMMPQQHDVYPAQDGSQIVLFIFSPPLLQGFPEYGISDLEAAMGRQLGGSLTVNGTTFDMTWIQPSLVPMSMVRRLHVLPITASCPTPDVAARSTADEIYTLAIDIAPFCFGDDAYWSLFAHAPFTVGQTTIGTKDYSYDGFKAAVSKILPFGSIGHVGGRMFVLFWKSKANLEDLPGQMQQIAGLEQTLLIQRLTTPTPLPTLDPDQPQV